MMYNNFMYSLAARAAEHLTGNDWEQLIKDRFFTLLDMQDSTFVDGEGPEWDNFAQPHMLQNGHCLPIPLKVHE